MNYEVASILMVHLAASNKLKISRRRYLIEVDCTAQSFNTKDGIAPDYL